MEQGPKNTSGRLLQRFHPTSKCIIATMHLVLASASPRRQELLAAAGFTFDVIPADVDEQVFAGEAPEAYARRVAIAKAAAVHARGGGHRKGLHA